MIETEEIKELKARIDVDADWFRALSDGDIPLEVTHNELIDRLTNLVQNKLTYCEIFPQAERQLIMNVFKLTGRLRADFFEESKRILTNAFKSATPLLEFEGEFVACEYHFQYSGRNVFYYIEYEEDGKRMTTESNIIHTMATLGDWHSPFFQNVFKKPATQPNERPIYHESSYQLILKSYLHSWLRWHIKTQKDLEPSIQATNDTPKPPTTDTPSEPKPPKFKVKYEVLNDILLDESLLPKIIKALYELGCVDSNGEYVKKKGNKTAFAALYALIRNENLIKPEIYSLSQDQMVNCFQNTFKIKISQPTLGQEISKRREDYKTLKEHILGEK
jgi:hypothetical protein